jgi:hypothetical protein
MPNQTTSDWSETVHIVTRDDGSQYEIKTVQTYNVTVYEHHHSNRNAWLLQDADNWVLAPHPRSIFQNIFGGYRIFRLEISFISPD